MCLVPLFVLCAVHFVPRFVLCAVHFAPRFVLCAVHFVPRLTLCAVHFVPRFVLLYAPRFRCFAVTVPCMDWPLADTVSPIKIIEKAIATVNITPSSFFITIAPVYKFNTSTDLANIGCKFDAKGCLVVCRVCSVYRVCGVYTIRNAMNSINSKTQGTL